MPDFRAFVDEVNAEATALEQVANPVPFRGAAKLLRTSARHAQLLQAVWEWANDLPEDIVPPLPGYAIHAMHAAKAHVRALLGEPEER